MAGNKTNLNAKTEKWKKPTFSGGTSKVSEELRAKGGCAEGLRRPGAGCAESRQHGCH